MFATDGISANAPSRSLSTSSGADNFITDDNIVDDNITINNGITYANYLRTGTLTRARGTERAANGIDARAPSASSTKFSGTDDFIIDTHRRHTMPAINKL